MPRATMTYLISKVRDIINDPANLSTTKFTDDQVQRALDTEGNRIDVRYIEAVPIETIAPGGQISFFEFWAPARLGDWETDATIYDSAWNDVTSSATADFERGVWTFAVKQTLIPHYIKGATYDVYGAAGDLVKEWAGKEKLSYAGNAQGHHMMRQQKFEMLLKFADELYAQSRPRSIRLIRPDIHDRRSWATWPGRVR